MKPEYSFCEFVSATPFSKWHIRLLTEKGQKFGGGADTLALCGRAVSWDLNVTITEHHLVHQSCSTCRDVYLNLMKGNGHVGEN
jgi:hypothetical protein